MRSFTPIHRRQRVVRGSLALLACTSLLSTLGTTTTGCSRGGGEEVESGEQSADAQGSSSTQCLGTASIGSPCDDGNPCTLNDRCNDSLQCTSAELRVCDDLDGNPCTAPECNAAAESADVNGCIEIPTPGRTFSDSCYTYECNGDVAAATGNSPNNPCTALSADLDACIAGYTCNPEVLDTSAERCIPQPHTGPCDDQDACTEGDSCSTGECTGELVSCDDSIACTDDSCNAATGCVHTAQPSACDDGNQCTEDTCDSSLGCTTTPLTGSACTDADACTTADTCVDGACVGQPVLVESTICNGIDDDCDGLTDEDCTLILRGQSTGDGEGSAQNDTFQVRHRIGAPRIGGETQNDQFKVRSGSSKGKVQ